MLASHGAITICKQHLEPSAICSTTSLTCSPKHNFRTYSFELFKNPKYSPHQVVQLCTSSMSSSLLVFPQQALQVCVFYCVISVKSDLNLGWFELFHPSISQLISLSHVSSLYSRVYARTHGVLGAQYNTTYRFPYMYLYQSIRVDLAQQPCELCTFHMVCFVYI